MSRFLRYLRIAFSATCLIACVLLIALWVRSNYSVDQVAIPITRTVYLEFCSVPDAFLAGFGNKNPPDNWGRNTVSTDTWLEEVGPWSGSTAFTIGYWGVGMPYWFGVLVSATCTALPWIRQLNWRFTTRTLLIATTLVAAVLGLIVCLTR